LTTKEKSSNPIGEHKIIEIIQRHLTLPKMPVPFGDDVSAIQIDEKNVAVLKTDMLVGKTDAPKQMNLYQAAKKAIVMNVSDFAAKGVQPMASLVSLGLPRGFNKKNVENLASGLNDGAQEYGMYVIGGDTNESSDLVISISLFGISEKSNLMLRNGAKADDILAVSGLFGESAAGLRLLSDQSLIASKKLRSQLTKAVLEPNARLREGISLGKTRAVTASIDSSDGLAWSLHEIAKSSGVGFVLNKIPTSNEAKRFAKLNALNAENLALYGGEEYELIITIKPDKWAQANSAVEKAGGKLLQIGKATQKKGVYLETDGKQSRIEPRGWEHFASKT
jgi:thiamine-monophosphate kinase